MLTCITCAKQTDDREEERGGGGRGTPSTKESIKSLTTQLKDMASKFSGAYKQCKPSTSPSRFKNEFRSRPDFDAASDGVPFPYMQPGSSDSTPAWAHTTNNLDRGGNMYSRFAGGERTPGGQESICSQSDVVLEEDDEPREWMAQVEPGVHITFVTLTNGGNDLKRIRFSREIFDKWQAQRWWGENYDRITELYNVQRFNQQELNTPLRSEDEQRDSSSYTRFGSSRDSPMITPSLNKDWTARNHHKPCDSKGQYPTDLSDPGGPHFINAGMRGFGTGAVTKADTSSVDASRTTTSSRDDDASVSASNASDIDTEWVEHDEAGVYITIRQLIDGTRELRRVRFSRERFGEVHAKLWWERNRDRIQSQYL